MEFEKKFPEWQGSRYAISVKTGKAALHVDLSTLGIGPGDEVIAPSYTFIAISFAVVQTGAIPRFAYLNLEDHLGAGPQCGLARGSYITAFPYSTFTEEDMQQIAGRS